MAPPLAPAPFYRAPVTGTPHANNLSNMHGARGTHCRGVKITFQSFFMLISVQPAAL
jgi:hypothetical protein